MFDLPTIIKCIYSEKKNDKALKKVVETMVEIAEKDDREPVGYIIDHMQIGTDKISAERRMTILNLLKVEYKNELFYQLVVRARKERAGKKKLAYAHFIETLFDAEDMKSFKSEDTLTEIYLGVYATNMGNQNLPTILTRAKGVDHFRIFYASLYDMERRNDRGTYVFEHRKLLITLFLNACKKSDAIYRIDDTMKKTCIKALFLFKCPEQPVGIQCLLTHKIISYAEADIIIKQIIETYDPSSIEHLKLTMFSKDMTNKFNNF